MVEVKFPNSVRRGREKRRSGRLRGQQLWSSWRVRLLGSSPSGRVLLEEESQSRQRAPLLPRPAGTAGVLEVLGNLGILGFLGTRRILRVLGVLGALRVLGVQGILGFEETPVVQGILGFRQNKRILRV